MEVKIRPLNKGETFACSIGKAKSIFKDTNVVLSFAFAVRQYDLYKVYPKKSTSRVVASIHMYNEQKYVLLNFYVLKQDMFPETLKEEFENNFLLKFYEFYQSLLNDKTLTPKNHLMIVELDNGKLRMYQKRF